MLDEFAFLGDELAHKVVIDNPNQLAATFEPIEVVKGDLIHHLLTNQRKSR